MTTIVYKNFNRAEKASNPIIKLPPEYPSYLKPIPVNTRKIEDLLTDIIKRRRPVIAKWLYSTWNAEREALKYQEIRNALKEGEISQSWLEKWRQDYSKFVNEVMVNEWTLAITEGMNLLADGIEKVMEARPDLSIPMRRVNAYLTEHGAELAVNLSDEQTLAVRNVLKKFAVDEGQHPTNFEKFLRPVIGLTDRETNAVYNYRKALIEEGMNLKKTEHLCENYSGYLQRRRTQRIARTEIADAYNKGAMEGVKQSVEQGIIRDEMGKRWLTGKDERRCPSCGAMEGQVKKLNEQFVDPTGKYSSVDTPSLHPQCRCTVIYVILTINGTPIQLNKPYP